MVRVALVMGVAVSAAGAEEWKMPRIELPERREHPVVACTAEELDRLREAWPGRGAAHDALAETVKRADWALGRPVTFPPRGGQHNQWYQCDNCEIALKTVDATHHRCPRCGTVYSGEPYDDVLFSKTHGRNLRSMTAAAWAYAITGDRKYAGFAREVLLGYAERYEKYPYHAANRRKTGWAARAGGHLCAQTLGEASAMALRIAPAYDLVHDALSEPDRAAIRSGLLEPILRNMDRNKAGKSNWQTWHNAGMLAGGAVLGDVSWVEKAIADPRNGFAYQMETSVTDDGMWFENSWGYHFYTLGAMVHIVEGARRLGMDLWGHPSLKKMFTLHARYAMPDGSLPRFGDDVSSNVRRQTGCMEAAYHAYGDRAILALLPAKPRWETVLYGRDVGVRADAAELNSEVFRAAGHAILRTRGEAGLVAVMTFGPYGGFHGHLDKLSFVFLGWDSELGVDPGRAKSQAYRLPIHRRWYKATVGHNAVTVDGRSQKPAAGLLERFAANESFAFALARCDEAYPGVTHRRLLCMTPEYLLVFDTLEAESVRRFDWIYHNRGSAARCDAAKEKGTLDESLAGAEYVDDVMKGATEEDVHVLFAGEKVDTHLVMAGGPGTEVSTAHGVGASIEDRVPLVLITRRGKAARFAAVIEPVPKGKKRTVTSMACSVRPGGAASISIDGGGRIDRVSISPSGRVTVVRDGRPVLP